MNPDSYAASDYAGVQGGDYDFYYGYEQTNDDDEWLFVAKVKNEEVVRWTAAEIGMDQWDRCERVLMEGMAHFFNYMQREGL